MRRLRIEPLATFDSQSSEDPRSTDYKCLKKNVTFIFLTRGLTTQTESGVSFAATTYVKVTQGHQKWRDLIKYIWLPAPRLIFTLRASKAAAQCIVIAPVCLCVFVCLLPRSLEIACIDPHQTGFIGKGSDHLQVIKFWPSRAPGKGSAAGRKKFGSALQPARSVCVASERFSQKFATSALNDVSVHWRKTNSPGAHPLRLMEHRQKKKILDN